MPAVVIKKAASFRDQVVAAILHDLQMGAIVPGARVTEEGLARRLSVSRTPIREALGQLAGQGTLHVRPSGGYMVPLPSDQEIRDIVAVRRLLEPPALRIIAASFTHAQLDAISRAIEREAGAAEVPNPARFARANEAFRTALFDELPNRALRSAIAQFNNHLHFIRAMTLADLVIRKQIVAKQIAIRDAIGAADEVGVADLWTDYLDFTEASLIGSLEKSLDGGPEAAPALARPRRSAS